MTVHIVLRVSTIEQSDGSSLDEQERRCRGAAMMMGLGEPVIYKDAGVSGTIPLSQRPEGGKMWKSLRRGDTVIAAKLDRLFRSAKDALESAETLRNMGVDLILADMGSDPVNGNGVAKMFFTMLAAVAEFERYRINERMNDGRRAKKEAGGHIGGPAPYGFTKIGAGRSAKLVPNPREAEVVDAANVLHKSGKTLPQISRLLAKSGWLSRNGKPFHSEQIRRMLEA